MVHASSSEVLSRHMERNGSLDTLEKHVTNGDTLLLKIASQRVLMSSDGTARDDVVTLLSEPQPV